MQGYKHIEEQNEASDDFSNSVFYWYEHTNLSDSKNGEPRLKVSKNSARSQA